MKKILIISFYFPPSSAIGGRRPYGLAKYLPKYGVEPIILTVDLCAPYPPNIKVIGTPYKDIIGSIKAKFNLNPQKGIQEQLFGTQPLHIKDITYKHKFITFLKHLITYPDEKKGWYRVGINYGIKIIEKEKIDAILSTSPPVVTHLIASYLKAKFHIPWIADLRDLWTQNPFYNRPIIMKILEPRIEKKTLNKANALITVSLPWLNQLKLSYKDKISFCLHNGFDEAEYNQIAVPLTNKFTITYTGQLYMGRRSPSLLFEAIRRLLCEGRIDSKLIELRFFCPKEDWIINESEKYNLNDIVNLYKFVPHKEIIKIQKESQLLLLIISKDSPGEYSAKLFEYLGAKRPIIGIGSVGVAKELLEETNAGKFATNIEELKTIIMQYYQEFLNSGEVKYEVNENIRNYTFDFMSKKYSDILNEIVAK